MVVFGLVFKINLIYICIKFKQNKPDENFPNKSMSMEGPAVDPRGTASRIG